MVFLSLIMKQGVLQSPLVFPDDSNTELCCQIPLTGEGGPVTFIPLPPKEWTEQDQDTHLVLPPGSACPNKFWVVFPGTPLLQAITVDGCQAPGSHGASVTQKCSCESSHCHGELQVADEILVS